MSCCFTDRHVEKESLAEYIAKKREMFLVQVIWLSYKLFLYKFRRHIIKETAEQINLDLHFMLCEKPLDFSCMLCINMFLFILYEKKKPTKQQTDIIVVKICVSFCFEKNA